MWWEGGDDPQEARSGCMLSGFKSPHQPEGKRRKAKGGGGALYGRGKKIVEKLGRVVALGSNHPPFEV